MSAAPGDVPATLGERVRLLRREAGLTQTQLAAGRVSKEYISQLERGTTTPSTRMLDWLAGRLGTDAAYLLRGITAAEHALVEAILASAEALARAHDDDAALAEFRRAHRLVDAADAPELSLRASCGEAWSLLELGRLDEAERILHRLERLVAGEGFSDRQRADVGFRLGVCRYRQSRIGEATAVLGEALRLAERGPAPDDALRSDIHHWRSRCHRRHSDWDAARADADRAVELAEGIGDARRAALAYFQASLVAEREGRWLLARKHAETARALFEGLGDRTNVGRLLNNLAGLNHLLGNSGVAVEMLRRSFEMAVDSGLEPDAGHVLCSLAEIELAQGDVEAAERDARKALLLLAGRADYRHEIGMTQLTLGRALGARGLLDEAERFVDAAAESFREIDSASHQATAWIARGELHERRGDAQQASACYRRAALTFPAPAGL